MHRFRLSAAVELHLQRGCLLADATAGAAIVSSANSRLMGSEHQRNAWLHAGRHSVDAAIHTAAGPELLAACQALPCRGGDTEQGVRVPPGGAVTTDAFGALRASHVIHCVSPRVDWGVERAPADAVQALRETYSSCLACAARVGSPSLAFPAIGIGVCSFPAAQAAEAALGAICVPGATWPELRQVQFVFREPRALEAWLAEAKARRLRPLM